jgi:hypothetical protein
LKLFQFIATILSKASHSDELLARINHTNIICHFKTWWIPDDVLKAVIQTLIAGIGDYLMRIVGSVPMGLHITLDIEGKKERLTCYYDKDFV